MIKRGAKNHFNLSIEVSNVNDSKTIDDDESSAGARGVGGVEGGDGRSKKEAGNVLKDKDVAEGLQLYFQRILIYLSDILIPGHARPY